MDSGSGSGFNASAWSGPIPSTDNLPPGTVVEDTYEILQKLGQGGMGAVYKARHRLLEKDVALKVIAAHMAQDQRFRARFLREAKVAMEFVHRHAVQIRHFAITREGICYMTMDFSPGESLQSILKREGALPARRAAKIMRQILEAVAEAHRKKIIHRDLKPDNVIVEKEGDDDWVKVLDFGLAKVSTTADGAAQELTLSEGNDKIVGTPAYMSPEQACGEDADHRSDLYSCGIILYQLLAGQVPFQAPTASAVMRKQVSVPPPPLAKVKPGLELPEGLEALVQKALAKEPAERFQSADQFAFALEGFAGERPRPGSTLASSGGAATLVDSMGQSTMTQEISGSLTGMTIDRYKIIAPLGEGGMGTVYKAEHILTHRTCAFKVIKADLTANPEAITRFRREAQISSKFKHPSAVEVYDFGRLSDAMFFLALEYVRGKPMTERLEKGPIPVRDAVEISTQALAALGAAHRAGIVHRDLKPDNIMLGEVGAWKNQVKILDFGIAKMQDAQGDAAHLKTTMGVFFGTPKYASPEQCSGHSVDGRSDVYTFGAILYEMLAGKPPFESDTPQGYLGQHMAVMPQRIKVFNPSVDIAPAVDAVVLKALAKAPADRYQTADEFIAALQQAARYAPRFDATEQGIVLGAAAEARASSPLLKVGAAVMALIIVAAAYVGIAGGGLGGRTTGISLALTPADAAVRLVGPDGAERAGTQASGGRWVFDGLAAGLYRLSLSRDGFDPLEREVAVESGRILEMPLALAASRVEERKRVDAGVEVARKARAAAVEAGAEEATPEPLARGDAKLTEAARALAESRYEVALGLADLARAAFEEAKQEAEQTLGEQARVAITMKRVEAAKAAAERAAARTFAESSLTRAESEERLAKEALSRKDQSTALARFQTAETLFQEAASRARTETERRLSGGRRALADLVAEAERLGAGASVVGIADETRAKVEAAAAQGDIAEAVRASESAVERLRETVRAAEADVLARRFQESFDETARSLESETGKAAEARRAALEAGAEAHADALLRKGIDAETASREAEKRAREARDRGAAKLTEAERSAALEALRTARARSRDARDAFLDAERAAAKEAERRKSIDLAKAALARADAAAAGFAEARRIALEKKAELGPVDERAREAETTLALARAAVTSAAAPGSEATAIARALDQASKAAELYQQAGVLAEAAALAASRPVGGGESGAAPLVEFTLKAFKKAMEEKNLDALGRCFVDFSSLKGGYKTMFANAKAIDVQVTPPVMTGDDSAEATFTMIVTEGSRRGKPTKAKLYFGRFGGGFKIASIEVVK